MAQMPVTKGYVSSSKQFTSCAVSTAGHRVRWGSCLKAACGSSEAVDISRPELDTGQLSMLAEPCDGVGGMLFLEAELSPPEHVYKGRKHRGTASKGERKYKTFVLFIEISIVVSPQEGSAEKSGFKFIFQALSTHGWLEESGREYDAHISTQSHQNQCTVQINIVGLTHLLFDYALQYLAASLYQTKPPFHLHFYANQPS